MLALTLLTMAAKMCIADTLAQRVSVFVTDFLRKTYGFLAPDYVTELRTLRNKVEDNYPVCGLITTPWKDENSEIETDVDTLQAEREQDN